MEAEKILTSRFAGKWGIFSILFSLLSETFLFLKEESFTRLMLAFLFLMIIMKEKGG
jgi:exosortase/archaeosortase